MKKKFLVLTLVLTLVMSLVGCSSKSDSDTGDSSKNNTSTDVDKDTGNEEETYKITMAYIGDEFADEAKVLEKVNEIMREDINMELDLIALNWGTYTNELTLMLSGNEKLDIIPIIITNASGYVNSGQVVDLKEYIDQYGTNIKEVVGDEFIATPNIDGFVYGVTSKREWITQEGVMMRADLLAEAGFKAEDINSLDDLDAVYAAVHAKNPEMIMLASAQASTPLFRWEEADFLTDGFGGLMDKGQSTEVVNLYETDEFMTFVNKMYEWNQAGYISKDAATTTEPVFNQVKAGTAFSYFTPMKSGDVEQDELTTGRDLAVASLFGDAYITSYSINFSTWGIAHNSKDKAKAFQGLDYIYGSSEIMNLLNWGIEGEHYEFTDDTKSLITYPEGVDASNKTYGLNIGWELPNQFIAHIWEGNDPSMWEIMQEDINNAERSKALGFSYDTTDVQNQITSLSNVKNEFYDAIGSGSVDPETAVPEFNKALYDAGLQTVIDLKQEQLDAWLATQ